jgi:hypothetical protein
VPRGLPQRGVMGGPARGGERRGDDFMTAVIASGLRFTRRHTRRNGLSRCPSSSGSERPSGQGLSDDLEDTAYIKVPDKSRREQDHGYCH